MERRYRAGGHSLQAVYTYRHAWWPAHVGDARPPTSGTSGGARRPATTLSDCVGCDPTSKVVSPGRRPVHDEEAVALAEPVLAGQLTCAEQPQAILTALLVPYLRTGRLGRGRRRAPPGVPQPARQPGRPAATSATTSEFCARTGNETARPGDRRAAPGLAGPAAVARRPTCGSRAAPRRCCSAGWAPTVPVGRRCRPAASSRERARRQLTGRAAAGGPVRRPQRHRHQSAARIEARLRAQPIGRAPAAVSAVAAPTGCGGRRRRTGPAAAQARRP